MFLIDVGPRVGEVKEGNILKVKGPVRSGAFNPLELHGPSVFKVEVGMLWAFGAKARHFTGRGDESSHGRE